jgi:hypothetical protein
MAEPNSPQPPVPPEADRLTGQLVHLPAARPVPRPPGDCPPAQWPPAHWPLTHQPLPDPVAIQPLPDPVAIQRFPDPVAIQPIAVPQVDPPFDLADDTATLDPPELISPIHEAGSLAPVTPAPVTPEAVAPAVVAPEASDAAHFAERYAAGPWPSQFAQALAETLAGTRPPSQLAPWITVQARRRIRRLSPVLSSASQPSSSQPYASQPRLRRVIISSPAGGVLEMTVVIGLGQRVRALAVRLEHSDSAAEPRWRCTAIEAA